MSDTIEPISRLTATNPYNPDSENSPNKSKPEFTELYGDDEKTAIREGHKAAPGLIIQDQISEVRDGIADRPERQRFWTEMMRNHELPPGDRLKASELLAKSEGDFN